MIRVLGLTVLGGLSATALQLAYITLILGAQFGENFGMNFIYELLYRWHLFAFILVAPVWRVPLPVTGLTGSALLGGHIALTLMTFGQPPNLMLRAFLTHLAVGTLTALVIWAVSQVLKNGASTEPAG